MGSAPYLGGGFGHFYAYAPYKMEYPIDRFTMEVKRQLDVLDKRLAENRYAAGDAYTIADMAIWPWYGVLTTGSLYGAAEFLDIQTYNKRLALVRRNRGARCGEARTDRQQDQRSARSAAPRAPRRIRLRASDAGQGRGGGLIAVAPLFVGHRDYPAQLNTRPGEELYSG